MSNDTKPYSDLRTRAPRWIGEGLEVLAERQDTTVAELLRQAARQFLERHDLTAPGLKAPNE